MQIEDLPAPLSVVYRPSAFKPAILSDEQQTAIDAATKAIPPDKHGALIFTATLEGINTVVAYNSGDHWRVAGSLGFSKSSGLSAGAQVVFVF